MKKDLTLRTGMLVLFIAAASLSTTALTAQTLVKRATSEVKTGARQLAKTGKAPLTSVNAAVYSSSVAKRSNWSDGSTEADILLEEDFSGFTAGSEDKPDTKILANYYGDPGMYIDKTLTSQDTWAGCYVYSAGGRVALVSPNEYTGADLDTPLGDYSGDLTITFRVKALVNSDLFVNLLKGGYAEADDATTKNKGNSTSYRVYASQGWEEITLKVSNCSSDNGGFIQFHNYGTIILDNIKVTTTANFIAAPTILAATDFTSHSFTANWQPVRKAFNYYLDLYKKVYLSNNDTTFTANFENADADNIIPSGWKLTQKGTEKIGETDGNNGGKGLIVNNGDTLCTPFDLAKVKSMSLWMHIYDPDPDTNYEVYDTEVSLDGQTLSGWEEIAYFSPDGFFGGKSINITKTIGSNKYYGVRLRVAGLPKGDYVVLDDISVTTGAPARLDTIDGDFPGYYYAKTNKTNYTFSGLDSLAEYYYTVKAHYILKYSEPEMQYAFGVSVPDLLPATDITSSGYTANWNKVPKATRYLVNNYGVCTADKDISSKAILDEDFSGITAKVTESTDPYNPEAVGNEEEIGLDSYTKNAGWLTLGTTVCQGMIGAEAGSESANYIITPTLYLDNDDNFNLTLKAYGTTGSALVIQTNNKNYAAYFESSDNSEHGTIDNTFTIPDRDKAQVIYLYTLDKTAFMLDGVKVTQNVKAGDKIYTWLGSKEVKADSLCYAFSGLDKYNYGEYAYTVKSYYDLDGATAESPLSAFQAVSLTGSTGIGNSTSISDAGTLVKEVARYNAAGIRISVPSKGLNIVKMSDGKVMKVYVR